MSTIPGRCHRHRRGITRVKFAANSLKLSLINITCNKIKKRKQKRNNNIEKEMRHRKRSRGAAAAGGNISGFHDDSAVVCEILSRLPVKSLVRFKCVCKHWRFLIEEDSYFIDLHLNQSKRNPKLIFVMPMTLGGYLTPRCTDWRQARSELVIVELVLEDKQSAAESSTAPINIVRKMVFPYENGGFFGPVNGLIGFRSRKYSGTCICNVSTKKISPWIKSTLSKDEGIATPHYEMGFDPATKKHKVVCIWRVYERYGNLNAYLWNYDFMCEVLTVGDNKWRRIENPPFELENVTQYYKRRHTVYVNGVIYYFTSNFMEAGELGNDKIVAFDVGVEKFRAIEVPNFILDQPRYDCPYGTSPNHLMELKGSLALVSIMSSSTAKLWLFDDDIHGNNVKEMNTSTSRSSNNQNWTEVTIESPCIWSAQRGICFHSVVGTDQIIIEFCERGDRSSGVQRQLYDCRTKSCKNIDTSGFEYFLALSRVSGLVESLSHVL